MPTNLSEPFESTCCTPHRLRLPPIACKTVDAKKHITELTPEAGSSVAYATAPVRKQHPRHYVTLRFGFLERPSQKSPIFSRRSKAAVQLYLCPGRTSNSRSDVGVGVASAAPKLSRSRFLKPLDLTPPITSRPPSRTFDCPRLEEAMSPTEDNFEEKTLKRNLNNEILNWKYWGNLHTSKDNVIMIPQVIEHVAYLPTQTEIEHERIVIEYDDARRTRPNIVAHKRYSDVINVMRQSRHCDRVT